VTGFGAEVLADGVRFRFWAPLSERVHLHLVADDRTLPMAAASEGWHDLFVAGLAPGARYRFVLPDGRSVPDPASRFQPEDVHGPSEVVDPRAYGWQDRGWRGRPFEECVAYELHVGTFTPEGTFAAAAARLADLAELGVTAVSLMPLADFPGRWNWGYDGVLLFAPDSSYGRPDDLRAFVDRAHGLGLMVFLDVVYNHFGPEGNYLAAYAPFFTDRHTTPWASRSTTTAKRPGTSATSSPPTPRTGSPSTISTASGSMRSTPSTTRRPRTSSKRSPPRRGGPRAIGTFT
jgi:maltooligosyltrehalose trehalohydrolase